MSDSESLYKIYGRYATKINAKVISEAVENAIPEEPLLLADADIDFLRQFDEDYWTQAIYKRNEQFFRYLVNLDNLRKKIRNQIYDQELAEVKAKFDEPKFASMNPFVKNRQIKAQADAAAKAQATKLLPAGHKIPTNLLKNPVFSKVKPAVKKALQRNINNINNYYLSKEIPFEGLRMGRSAPETIVADPKIEDLAKHVEGEFGSKAGHDLHNPRIVQGKKLDHQAMEAQLKQMQDTAKQKGKPMPTMSDVVEVQKTLEPKFVTDGFVFPSYTEIQTAIRDKIKAVRSGLSVPQDATDEARPDALNQSLGYYERPTHDVGVHPTEKQLLAQAEAQIRHEDHMENVARKARGLKEIDKPANKIRDEAKQRIRKELQKYMPENFKSHLKNLGFTDAEIKDVKNPYGDTNITLGAEGFSDKAKLIKQNPTRKNDEYFRRMSGKVRNLKDGKVVEKNVNLPALFKSGFYKDVSLDYKHDSGPVDIDTTVTNLIPGNALSEKFFDKELFERLVRRFKFARDPKNASAPELPAVLSILKRHNLSTSSSPEDIMNAAYRNFYQKADKSDYKQGSNVSSTWAHHPTRLSAKLDFFNRFHDKAKYDDVVSTLLDRGVKRTKGSPPVSLFDYIVFDINEKLDTVAGASDELPKLVMQRVKDTIVALVQLRVFESLGNRDILKYYGPGRQKISCFDNPGEQGCFGNGGFISDIVNKELKRIKDQDLFTGSIRKRGQLAGSDELASAMSCKLGSRAHQTGRCVYGADLRVINDFFQLGNKKLLKLAALGEEASAEDGEESIVEERKKIRYVLEGLNEMNEAIIVLMTALNKARDPKISDDDAKLNARHELTNFLKANINKDYPQFIKALHKFYNDNFQALTAVKKKAAENLKIPSMIRHRRENKPTTHHFFSKRFAKAAAGEDFSKVDEYQDAIENTDINKLVKIYNTILKHDPSLADQVYNKIVSKITDPEAKLEFENRLQAGNARLKKIMDDINTKEYVRYGLTYPFMFLHPYDDITKYPPQTHWSSIYQKYIPFLTDKNLLKLSRALAENIDYVPQNTGDDLTPDEKAYNQQMQKQVQRFMPMRHLVLDHLHKELQKRNLMTSVIARINSPEALEQFAKSSEKVDILAKNYDKKMAKQPKPPNA